MKTIYPEKLRQGSHIRVISPSRSMKLLSPETRQLAIDALRNFGFTLSFGKHVDEFDEFLSSSVASRVADLHDAFSDPSVDGIFTVIGGYNSNQLLDHIDYDLIQSNPKYLCGFSDITVLSNAIYAKTGIAGCSGPHFSSWAIQQGFEYAKEYFEKCCMQAAPYKLQPSPVWSDDAWYLDQEKREFIATDGFDVIQTGVAEGTFIGGHMRCLACLQGTQYMPSLRNAILLIEEDEETNPRVFDRLLQSFIHLPDSRYIKAIIIGRFQKATNMTPELLKKIIKNKQELAKIPIVANVTLGHTMPIATFPIGGTGRVTATGSGATLEIINH
jgi:muramoyltetrapeptide carboxypeptidase